MDNERVIPYIAFESTTSQMERTIKRLWVIILVLIFLLVGSNIAWLIYESQYEYYTTSVTQENADGYNNYIGNDGDINNGKADGNN